MFDKHHNLIEVLGRLADLALAQAAYEACVKKYPDKCICLRLTCRVIRSNDKVRCGALMDPFEIDTGKVSRAFGLSRISGRLHEAAGV